MIKYELDQMLKYLDIPVGEGEQFIDQGDDYPKVAYWEYVWTDAMSSGRDYEEVVTYQVSFVSRKPRHPKLLELKQMLNDKGLHPVFYHEYVKGTNAPGYFHTYFSIDVEEVLTEV
jgi:hypothetical protein